MLKKQLIKSGVGSIGVKATFALLSFAISVVLARNLGAEGFGIYAFVIATIMLAAIPAMVGVPDLIVRETAKYQAHGNWTYIAGLWRWGNKVVIIRSIAILLGGSLIGFILIKSNDDLKSRAISIAILIVPMAALIGTKSACIRGLRHTVIGQLPESLIRPTISLILIILYPISIAKYSVIEAITLYVFSVFIAFLFCIGILAKIKPEEIARVSLPEYDSTRWRKAVLPLALISGMHVINGYVDIIILGLYREDNEVGIYRATVQLSLLVSFGLQAINQVLHPHFSRLYSLNEHIKLQKLVRLSSRIIFSISLPPVILLVLYGKDILRLVFGDPFYVGGLTLSILSIAQLINAAMGSVGALLNMTGHERYTLKGVVLAAIVNVILNFILIPIYGMLGAALASVASLALWNLLLRHYVKKKLNIEPSAIFKMSPAATIKDIK